MPKPVEADPIGADQVELGPATTVEVNRRPTPVLLVPLGATEQHGPHLPLDTDTVIATAWARAVARGLGAGAVVAPALPYGSSGEHQGFAGTLSIGGDALAMVLIELARSARSTFDRVVLLSGHAGNEPTLRATVDRLGHEGHAIRHLVPTWPGSDPPVDAHAGRTETSLMLHLQPERVRSRTLWARGDDRPLAVIIDRLVTGGVAAVSANGVLGDPSGASATEGQVLFDDLVDRTVTELTAWATTSPA